MKHAIQIFWAPVLATMLTAPAFSQPQFNTDTKLSLGVFITNHDTETTLESNLGQDTDIDFENDLGLDSSLSVFRLDGSHRFGEKHRVGASIFDLSRNAVTDIDGEITWQDTVFPIAARIKTDLDFTIYKLAYTYEFLQRDNAYLGASIGLYTADIGIVLEDELSQAAETGDVTAPLPVIGLRGAYALTENWIAFAGAEIFFADFDEIEGFLYDVSVGIDYWFSDSVAIGLAWNGVEIDVDARSEALDADLVWRYSGALLSVKFGF
jgi:hypothetical protein